MKKKSYREELQTVSLTSPAVCESIAKVLIDHKVQPKLSIADLSYAIARALGFRVAE